MDEWARRYGDRVRFFCVSCAGPGLAREMGKEMRLQHCVNGFIESRREMPKWGQLGCNGFIVFDEKLNVVCRKSKAYLEVRDRAFDQVTEMIDQMLARIDAEKRLSSKKRGSQGDEAEREADEARRRKARVQPCYRDGWTPKEEDETILSMTKPVKTMNVAVLDEQHRACEVELEGLVKEGTHRRLERVRRRFAKHFAFEANLLTKALRGDEKDEKVAVERKEGMGFDAGASKLNSHLADHERILGALSEFLTESRDAIRGSKVKDLKIMIQKAGGRWSDCVTKSDIQERAMDVCPVSKEAIRTTLDAWTQHEKYDQGCKAELMAFATSSSSRSTADDVTRATTKACSTNQ